MTTPRPEARPRRLFSVGKKLALAMSLVMALVTAAVYSQLSRFERDKVIKAKEQAARMACELFLRSITTPVVFDDATGIKDAVAMLAQDPEVIGVELWRASAARLAGARIAAQFKHAGMSGAPPRFVEGTANERRQDRIILRAAVRDPDQRIIAVLAVQYSLARENAAFAALRHRILLSAAGVVALLAGLLWLVTRRWITGPLGRLLQAVRQVEAGERVDLLTAQANDEVGRLAEAFGRMVEAVDHRERDIVRRNSDMKMILDNVAQGFCTLTREGGMLPEHSAILEEWFGPWQTGALLWDYLAKAAPKDAEWFGVLWSNVSGDVFPLEMALEQLPTRLQAGERTFSLASRPIVSGDEVNILIVLSDITLEIAQERAKVGQQELVSIFQHMVKDRSGLLEFFDDAERLVAGVTGAGADLVVLKRDIHTLKGNSGVYGLVTLVSVCQEIESRFADGAEALCPEDREALRATWHSVSERRRQLFGEETTRRLEIDLMEQQALMDSIERRAPQAVLLEMVRSFRLEPSHQRLRRIGDQLRSLALSLGKGEIAVRIESNNIRLPDELGDFWVTFAHLSRNAVDHGLEGREERQRRGKSAAGTIWLRTAVEADNLVVEIEDDGRGIDWARLAEKARAAGLKAETQEDLVEALFADGISTKEAVTETSGRGVGMSAVRSAVAQTGGTLRVHSRPGEGTRFSFLWCIGLVYQNGTRPSSIAPRPVMRRAS